MKVTMTRLITSLVLFAAVAMTSAMFLLGSSTSHGIVSALTKEQDERLQSGGENLTVRGEFMSRSVIVRLVRN